VRKRQRPSASIEADNSVGDSKPFLYFPQNTTYEKLPGDRLLIRSKDAGDKYRHLIARSAWAETKEVDAPLYGHTTTLTRLGIRPGLPPENRATIDYQPAHWWDVLLWGDNVAVSVVAALLTVISTGLGAFVTHQDHPKGIPATLTLIVLIFASGAAIINVIQQFLG
jgi:hypothetical protein